MVDIPYPSCNQEGWIYDNRLCKCIEIKKPTKLPRCPNGYRRNKTTKLCEQKLNKQTKQTKSNKPKKPNKQTTVIANNTPALLQHLGIIAKQTKSNTTKSNTTKSNTTKSNTTKKSKTKLQKISKKTTELIKQSLHSFSPEINKLLVSEKTGDQNDIFGCGIEDILKRKPNTSLYKTIKSLQVKIGTDQFGNPICVGWNTKKAQTILLDNLKRSRTININNVIAPMQSLSNCWFNTMFIAFFISDKGRKFFKFFRQLMIKGEFADGYPIDSVSLKKALFLLNAAIEASINPIRSNNIAQIMDTNNIIQNIYRNINRISNKSKIYSKVYKTGIPGNPIRYYSTIMHFLSSKYKTKNYNIYMHEVNDINKLYSNKWSLNKLIYKTDKGYYEKAVDEDRLPDIIVVDKYENEKNSKQPPFDKGTPKQFTIKNNSKSFTYKLDSAIVRDTKKQHFCAVLTCNKKHYGFDGASFSKISHFNWLDFLNKNKNWTFKGSTWKNTNQSILWNFTKSYQILIYYRI